MGGQSGCERRIEIFVKIQKKNLGGGGLGSGVGGGGGQGGCEQRIEVFVKSQKEKIGGGGGRGVSGRGRVLGGGVRGDVNEELKFL